LFGQTPAEQNDNAHSAHAVSLKLELIFLSWKQLGRMAVLGFELLIERGEQ
jgi:hypothetical protein